MSEAKELIGTYFNTYPGIRIYIDTLLETAREKGYVETLFGRRRMAYNLYSDNMNLQRAEERVLVNMPIQGTSADMTKLAMANLRPNLQPLTKAWLVNAIHDELVVECEAADAPDVAKILQEAMVSAGRSLLPDIPIEVDVTTGLTWSK